MSEQALFVGVDGGGTSCEVRVANAAGDTLGEGRAGPANIATNTPQARISILKACTQAFQQAGLDDSAFTRSTAVLGLAGANVGDYASHLKKMLPFAHAHICSDGEIALKGALGSANGTVAIIGTGSIFYHQHTQVIHHVGGWGSFLSDQSGGAWLGRALLEHTLLGMDEIASHSELSQQIASTFNEQQALLVCGPAHATETTSSQSDVSGNGPMQHWRPELLGHYAQAITVAADKGDSLAKTLMQTGARHIELIVESFSKRSLNESNDQQSSFCLLGGLGPFYRPWLSTDLQARVRKPLNDALHGAIDMALTAASDAS